jgi:hypothetical protein
VLGKSTWEATERILLEMPDATSGGYFRGVTVSSGPIKAILAFFLQFNVIQELDIVYRTPTLSAGDIVAWEKSCAVYRLHDPNAAIEFVLLAYPDRSFWVATHDWNLDLSSGLLQIEIFGPEFTKPKPNSGFRNPCWVAREPEKYGWKGFRRKPSGQSRLKRQGL